MATPDEVRRRLREVEAGLQPFGPPGRTAVPGYGATQQPINLGGQTAAASNLPPGAQIGPDGMVYVPKWDAVQGDWTWELAPQWVQKAAGVIGDEGGGGRDPVLARLTEEQILSEQAAREIAASEEARAAEMQPYDIAESQAATASARAQIDYNQKSLERQMVSDKFDRAYDAFESSRLAESLANEKKRTATTLLTSIVDNLVPPGMEHPPGLGDQPWPTVAQIDWSQLGGGLDPQTDQAVQYLLAMQQQNQGV